MRREYWHLTEGLIFIHFAVFLLSYANPDGLRALALVPGEVAARPWSACLCRSSVTAGPRW